MASAILLIFFFGPPFIVKWRLLFDIPTEDLLA